MSGRHRRDATDGYVRWLGASAVTLGLGAAITAGHGVAAATPGEPSDSTSTTSSSAASTTENHPDNVATGGSAETGAIESALDPASTASAQHDDTEAEAEAAAEAEAEAAAEALVQTADVIDEVEEVEEVDDTATTHVAQSSASVEVSHDTSNSGSPSAIDVPKALVSREDSEASTVETPVPVEASATLAALFDSVPVTFAARQETLTRVSAAAPSIVERRVTLVSMVGDVFNWLGFRHAATDLPVPPLPFPTLVESLWLAIRQTAYNLNNQRPTAQPTISAQGPDGVAAADGDGSAPHIALDPDKLADLLAHEDVTIYLNANGAIDRIDGTFTDTIVMNEADVVQVINELAPLLGAAEDFASADTITVRRIGENGTAPGAVPETFYRVRHSINGIPVLGSDVIVVTDSAGTVTSLFNDYDVRVDDVDLTPGATGVLIQTLLEMADVDSTLVVFAMDSATPPRLAWQIVVDPSEPAGVQPIPGATYFVDANGVDAGALIFADSHAEHVAITANDYLGQARQIQVEPATGVVQFLFFVIRTYPTYALHDAGRKITTYKTVYSIFGLGGPVLPGVVVTRNEYGWNSAAVSAHANTAASYDYYADVLGLNSFDGNGAAVRVSTNYNPNSGFIRFFLPSRYNNAFWDPGNQRLVFGDGGALQAALDIVAHEYTHAVVSYAVGDGGAVLYYGESGAVNEAYADILGVLVEGKSGPDRWLIGEDSALGVLRNLADPDSINTSYGAYRDHYNTRYTGTGDDGGEHVNSTILSHAAYLMMTDPATSDISDETWAAVFHHSLYRLNTDANFADARVAIVDTADAFHFTDTQLMAIEDAFDDVGIAAGVTALV